MALLTRCLYTPDLDFQSFENTISGSNPVPSTPVCTVANVSQGMFAGLNVGPESRNPIERLPPIPGRRGQKFPSPTSHCPMCCKCHRDHFSTMASCTCQAAVDWTISQRTAKETRVLLKMQLWNIPRQSDEILKISWVQLCT